jgi:ABC-type multidrug transport system fused ATPase/permease subunit
MSENPYQPPQSPLEPERAPGRPRGGSLAAALEGRYDFSLPEVFEEAWRLVRGAKRVLWLAILMLLAVYLAGSFLEQALRALLPAGAADTAAVLLNLALNLVSAPMAAGLALLGARRASGLSIEPEEVLRHFDRTLAFFLTALISGGIVFLFAMLGMAVARGLNNPLGWLLAVPAVYFAIAYQFGGLLVADKRLRPWAALECSRRALTHQFGKVLALFLVLWLSVTVGLVATFFVGAIWLVPFAVIVQGVVYRQIFGVEGSDGEAPEPGARMLA